MIIVLPNRRGPWARVDTTPFGHGRPYSRTQVTQLLRETWFTPNAWSEALHLPPIRNGWFLRSAGAWERSGATISAPFAGVHLVEATKQVYRAIPARRERRRATLTALRQAAIEARRAGHPEEAVLDEVRRAISAGRLRCRSALASSKSPA